MDLISSLPFDLVTPSLFNFNRRAVGDFVDGVFIRPAPTVLPISALIYPVIKQNVINLLPEALRTRKVIRIHSNISLKEQIDGDAFEADEVVYSGQSYRVFKLGNWEGVNGFTAYEAYAVRIDDKELPLIAGN